MSQQALTLQSPLSARFKAWMDERFPLKNSILSILVYFSTALVVRSAAGDDVAIKFTDLVGCLVTWSLFFILRVFDEHKDYELDVKNHPHRVLQSGLITLAHLKIAGAICIAIQLLWCFILDGGAGPAMTAWAIMFFWACLMTVEFFCGEWLEKRLTLYAFSHMLIMFLIGWWAANMASANAELGFGLVAHLLMLFIGGFAFEITRKTRGPEEERDTVDSYTRVFGIQGATYLILGLVTGLVLIQAVVVAYVAGNFWVGFLLLLATFGMTVKQLFAFLSAPSLPMREKNEKFVGVLMVVGFFTVITAVIVTKNIQFSFV